MLGQIPSVQRVQIEEGQSSDGSGADLAVNVWMSDQIRTCNGPHYTLLSSLKSNGLPKWVRSDSYELSRYIAESTDEKRNDTYGVVLALYIPPESAQILRKQQIGYLDLVGNWHLEFADIYVQRRCYSNSFPDRSELRRLFCPKASRVARLLLMSPYKGWRIMSLAVEAEFSVGLVAKVRYLLLDRECAELTPNGMALVKPAEALQAWSSFFSPSPPKHP